LNNGFHLGGIRVGGTNWLWRASPAVTWMNGCGSFEIANGVNYPGNTVQTAGRNVIYGYNGEFFRNEGEAAQNMHYYDDGLFVGQFGEASPGHSAYEGALPAFAGNAACQNLTATTNGDYYLWVSDESNHGPQRWHFANARNIRELTGSGTLGSAITLTIPTPAFPTGVTGKSGNQSAEITWLAVPGASSYNVRWSQINGGPYSVLATNSIKMDCVVSGLTNGQTYYFVVTAIQSGVEGIPSEQVKINPFDTTQNVLCTGSMAEGGQFTPTVDVTSSAPAAGLPSDIGAEQFTGVLNLRELDDYGYGNLENESVGARGYVLYDWGGFGSNLNNIPGAYTVTTGSGWSDIQYLERQYRVDSSLGANDGLSGSPAGSINIGVNDANYHFLTVVSPSQFNNARQFTLRLASTNNTVASYAVNEPYGYSHVFQFKFKGNVTLTADATGGSGAIVQSIFLDDASVTYPAALVPPAQFHIIGP
jgi:hypothetical protein